MTEAGLKTLGERFNIVRTFETTNHTIEVTVSL